jgi:hypothetical protein
MPLLQGSVAQPAADGSDAVAVVGIQNQRDGQHAVEGPVHAPILFEAGRRTRRPCQMEAASVSVHGQFIHVRHAQPGLGHMPVVRKRHIKEVSP